MRHWVSASVALLASAVSLAGCGFAPLYAQSDGKGTVVADLGAIDVAPIVNREGQELRSDLETLLASDGSDLAAKYDLQVSLSINESAISIDPQTASTHTRVRASATWTLMTHDSRHVVVKNGAVGGLDGFDVVNQQFFAADLDTSAAIQRLDQQLAQQIVEEIALFLRGQQSDPG